MPSPTNPPDWHRERVMVFIDGSNLYHVLSDVCSRHDLNFGKFAEKLADGRHLVRTYYYNIRQGPSESGMPSEQEKFLQSLYETPYLEIRMGISKKQGEMMVEKGVDVFMATDMVAFAFMDLYDTAIMVSGDGDFFPAIQAAKNQGKHIEVAAFEDNLSPEAANVADKVTLLNKSYFTGLWHDRRRRSTTSSRSGTAARSNSSSSSSNGRSAAPSQPASPQKAETSPQKKEESPAATTPEKSESESPARSASSGGRSSTRGGARRRRVSSTGASGRSGGSGSGAETQEAQSADQTNSSSSSDSSDASRSSRTSPSRSRRSRGGRSRQGAGESAESNDQEASSSSDRQVRRTPVRRRVGGARAQPEDGGDQGTGDNKASGWLPRPPM
ncbi:MAG: NYN domain-containing protein, partial [Chloroflexota bacterium]